MHSSMTSALAAVALAVLSLGACGSSGASPPAGGAAGAGGGGGAAGSGAQLSAGCASMLTPADKANAWTKHDIDLPAGTVDAAFVAAHPPNAGSQYGWMHRNYFLKLPAGYDGTTPFPVTIAGTACAGSETVGASGEYSVPTEKMNVETGAIKISQ